MAIEKNSFKSSRLESEFSSHSREVMMSSDEDEFQRYNSGAVESEDDDDDDEFDDCDSGAGSDDFDLLELGESGEEFCQVGDQTCSIPYELYDLQGLGDVLSMDVWNDVLTEEERFFLTQYLPDMDQETFMRTLKDLLTGCNLHFGNPLDKLFNMLKGGLCEPRVALYRQGLIFFQKHQHYHLLRKYQNVMVNSFCQIRDGWQNCRGYSIEEKLRVLNIMKTQNSYISEKMEEMESDESDREGSGDAFWGKRIKDRKHGQKSARYSGYGGSAIDLLYPGKQTAAEPAKFGKQNSKGALKLTGTKGSAMKDFSGNFPSVHHEMEINAGYYGSQPFSHHGKIAGYDSGMTVHTRDRFLGDEDDDEGMYELSVQRNFSRAGLKDKAGHFKMGKKHDGLRSEEYLESLTGLPVPLKPELYATGRKKTIHQLFDTTVSKPLNARAPYDFGSKANYVENLQQFPSEDRMIYGKGRMSNPSLKGSRMELADESDPFWLGKGQMDPYLTNPSQKYNDWNPKSKKWKHQESSDLKQNDFHSGYKAKPFQEKFRATLHSDHRGVAGSKGRRGILKNEETESDSSEEIDEEDDDNPLLKSKLAFPFPCDAPDMKSGSNAKKAKFVKKNKRGGFDEHLSSIKAGNLGSRAEQKGKMLDYSRVNILSARELDENYLSGQGQLIDDNDEDDDNDDQPIYKLARNGRIQGDYRPSLREKQKGRFGVPQSNCMQDFGLHGEEDLSRTQLLANDNEGITRSGKKSQTLEMFAGDHQERSDLQLMGCSSTLKKRKIKEDVSFMDEQGDNEFTQLQLEDASSSKKRGKRKLESETGNSEKAVSELPSSDIREEDVHQESILQKKPFTLITPTVHTGFSFSIIHLLSAIRMAMTSLLSEDSLEVGKNLDQDDGRQKSEEERGLKQEGLNGVKTQAELDVNGSLSSHEMRIPSLAVQEIVNRVKSNPGDPCILETQEPLQDLVRGVLKIFSSKTAPLGAKGWKPLVVYEKSTKSWSWVGPVHHTSSDHEAMEEVTSPEAWGLNHKMLVKLVDSFANWLKNGQETLQQIGSLPAPPSSLTQYNFDEKERFRDLRAQKSLTTITPSSEEVRAYFRKEEVLRYSIPDRAFSYTAIDGKKSIVAPLRRCGGKPTSKARDHFMLKRDRPPHVTILCLVRDAAARLPGSIGTRADVCTLIRDSQYIVEDVSDTQVNQVVSGALDRLHYERDPCVQFDTERKLWVYLHREREEEDFEDDGTSSTKKWKRQKKESAEPIDQAAVTVAYHGPGDQNVGDLGSDPNFDLPNIHEDKGKELEYEDSRDLGDDNVENHHGTETQVASDAMGENKLLCQENSTNDNFDDET